MDRSDRQIYMDRLLGAAVTQEKALHNVIADIAWSLHVIASTLLEHEGYVDAEKYMNE